MINTNMKNDLSQECLDEKTRLVQRAAKKKLFNRSDQIELSEGDDLRKVLPKKLRKMVVAPKHPFPDIIGTLRPSTHFVSAKADGIRSGLYIDDEGIAYYVYATTWAIFTIGQCTKKEFHGSFCDAELMLQDCKYEKTPASLLIFDLLHCSTKSSSSLLQRVEKCKEIVNAIKLEPMSLVEKITVKRYHPLKDSWKLAATTSEPARDGLIFTPKIGKPGKNCIRWKPAPTITVELHWNQEHSIFVTYLLQIHPRKHFIRSVPYDLNKGIIRKNAREATYFNYGDLLQVGLEDKDVKQIEIERFELIYKKDAFNHDGYFSILRIRKDKLIQDSVARAEDLIPLMINPPSLANLLRVPPSYYRLWTPRGKRYQSWIKYHSKIKDKVYRRFCNGSILDMCAGRGEDALRLYRLGNATKITCVEADKMQVSIAKEMTVYPNADDLGGRTCKIRFHQGDAVDPKLMKKLNIEVESYDRVLCSFGIHYLFDAEMGQDMFINLIRPLKIGGRLVLLFMDGDRLVPNKKRSYGARHIYCDCSDYHGDSSEPVHRADTYQTMAEERIELYYKHERPEIRHNFTFGPSSHVLLKLPHMTKPVRETIVRIPELVTRMRNQGLQLTYLEHFPDIIKNKTFEHLSKLYCAAVFTKHNFKLLKKSPFLDICYDALTVVFSFLDVFDIKNLLQVHPIFVKDCTTYLGQKPTLWETIEKERDNLFCTYHSGYYS